MGMLRCGSGFARGLLKDLVSLVSFGIDIVMKIPAPRDLFPAFFGEKCFLPALHRRNRTQDSCEHLDDFHL
ncbi:MAG: hypothetical protein ACI8QF_004332 [Limisphaerales bacterium]|jgi:hypothetical protein